MNLISDWTEQKEELIISMLDKQKYTNKVSRLRGIKKEKTV